MSNTANVAVIVSKSEGIDNIRSCFLCAHTSKTLRPLLVVTKEDCVNKKNVPGNGTLGNLWKGGNKSKYLTKKYINSIYMSTPVLTSHTTTSPVLSRKLFLHNLMIPANSLLCSSSRNIKEFQRDLRFRHSQTVLFTIPPKSVLY